MNQEQGNAEQKAGNSGQVWKDFTGDQIFEFNYA